MKNKIGEAESYIFELHGKLEQLENVQATIHNVEEKESENKKYSEELVEELDEKIKVMAI